MRTILCVFPLLIAAACGNADRDDAAVADATLPEAQASSISLSDVSGEWQIQAMPEGQDSVVATYRLHATGDSVWTMKFDHQEETLPVHIVAVEGDSILAQVGPYSSALRPGVSVMTFAMYRLDGDTLRGRAIAHYNVTTPDSVRYIHTKGTRVP